MNLKFYSVGIKGLQYCLQYISKMTMGPKNNVLILRMFCVFVLSHAEEPRNFKYSIFFSEFKSDKWIKYV